jgi:hypothetical protein
LAIRILVLATIEKLGAHVAASLLIFGSYVVARALNGTRFKVNGYGAAYLLPGLGLLCTVLTTRKQKLLVRKSILSMRALGFLIFIALFSLFAAGCGSSKSATTQTPAPQVTLMVTGTSGAVTQFSPVTITIN